MLGFCVSHERAVPSVADAVGSRRAARRMRQAHHGEAGLVAGECDAATQHDVFANLQKRASRIAYTLALHKPKRTLDEQR